MPRDVSAYSPEISHAIEKIRGKNKTIITRTLIEEEIVEHPLEYPVTSQIHEFHRKIVVTEVINQRPDAIRRGKRPASWYFDPSHQQGVSA